MTDYKEDTNKDFRTMLFVILFSIFVLAFSNIQGNNSSSSAKHYTQTELTSEDISGSHSAVICNVFNLPVLQKYFDYTPRNTSLNPISIQNNLSCYNRTEAHNFALIQNKRLSIKPLIPMRLYLHLPSASEDDLPVLS